MRKFSVLFFRLEKNISGNLFSFFLLLFGNVTKLIVFIGEKFLCLWLPFGVSGFYSFFSFLIWADFEDHIEKHDQVMEDSRLIQIRVKP